MTSSLRIAWVNELASPVGGAERYIAATAERLRERGVDSVLLYEMQAEVSPQMARAFEGTFPIVDLAHQVAALQPDVIYVHQLSDRRVLPALLASGRPVLRFFHDHKLFCLREGKYTTLRWQTCTRTVGVACYPCLGFVRRSDDWPGLRLASVSQLRSDQRANQRLQGFVVGSEYMADHLAAHGFDRSRTHVLPLWVSAPAPAADDRPREPDLLLFVGQLIRGKGLDVLLAALTRTTRPARLAVVGAGRLEQECRALASSPGLQGRVAFLGRLGHDELASWYRRAACVVLPTRAPETFGLVGVEAQSHGTPVIASRVGGIPEWLEDGGSGLLVPPSEPAALAAAIDRVLGDHAIARRMGERGREIHQARYRPEHHVGPLLELLRSTTRHGRTR